jgi:ceramide glucosyltransferase
MIYTIIFLFTSLAVLAILTLITLFMYGYYKNLRDPPLVFTPKVCVIVPCKEKEFNLEQNLEAICTQHYPEYSVIFVVDSDHDAAYPTVISVAEKTKNSRVIYTQKIEGCSGKISALITGIQNAGDVEVYVFADSDITPHPDWLRYLVSYLSDETIGATTGFRWYFPDTWKSSLISTWNMAAISALSHPLTNYVWGGSTAIRADLFDTLDVESNWKKGFSDDLILTETVKNAGYSIRFLPKCLSESPSDVTMKKFLYWGSQQFTWIRWYSPFIWLISCGGVILIDVFSLVGFVLIGTGHLALGLLMVSLLFFEMMYGLVGILVVSRLMGYPKKKFRFMWRYVLLMPVVFFLYGYNALVSSVKKQIVWAGRTYQKRDVVR